MLQGTRILDMTRLLPGPFATQILADLGAEVIKIEEPGVGDYARNNPYSCVDNMSASFHALNRGKKSVVLNLKKKPDLNKLLSLLNTTDVLVESFRPGVLKKLGISPEYLHKTYPSLIICSISGYGQTGPDKLRAGHDINYISRAGLTGLMKNPCLPPSQIADLAGGAWPAAFQIMAALYNRKVNKGQGNIIDVSMTDCSYALGCMPQAMSNNTNSRGEIANGKFVLVGSVACYNVYKCKDNTFISVGALEPKFWYQTCKAMNAMHLVSKGLVSIEPQATKIKNEVQSIFNSKTGEEWKNIFKNYDCCVEVIPNPENISIIDPQLKSRNLDINIEIKHKNKTQILRVPKMPLNMKYGTKFSDKPAPTIGRDTNQILSKL